LKRGPNKLLVVALPPPVLAGLGSAEIGSPTVWLTCGLALVVFVVIVVFVAQRKIARQGARLRDVARRLRQRRVESRAIADRAALMLRRTPAILWTTDHELRFTSSSGAGLAELGLRPIRKRPLAAAEFFGRDDEEFVPIRMHRRALEGRTGTYEHQWHERTFHCHVEPLQDEDGAVIGTVGVALDITDRKRAERALLDEFELLSTTLESIEDAVCTITVDGDIVLLNEVAEKLTGVSHLEAVGCPVADVFRARDANSGEWLEDPFARVLQDGRSLRGEGEWLLVARDGRERSVAHSVAPIKSARGETHGAVLVMRDVTEKRRMHEEILKASKLESLGVLAGGIAHDFNNILTAVLGHISLARLGVEDDETITTLQSAERATLRARDLTHQLMTFSKGGAPLTKAASIGDLLRESASFALSGTCARLDCRIDDGLDTVEADEVQLSRVIHNLVLNAAQAMPKGGIVSIRGRNEYLEPGNPLSLGVGDYVVIDVADQGVGIPREQLVRIFDPYYTTKESGSGLGLAICYSIVRRHGGVITVDSGEGQGTTFRIYLRATRAPVVERSVREEEMDVSDLRVLVIDDEELVRDVLARLLRRMGAEVSCVADGEAGMERYEAAKRTSKPFDAVILDLTIAGGGMGGKETIRRLLRFDPDCRAIVCSGYSNDPVLVDYRNHGFRGRVTKPFRVDDLRRCLTSVVADELEQ